MRWLSKVQEFATEDALYLRWCIRYEDVCTFDEFKAGLRSGTEQRAPVSDERVQEITADSLNLLHLNWEEAPDGEWN